MADRAGIENWVIFSNVLRRTGDHVLVTVLEYLREDAVISQLRRICVISVLGRLVKLVSLLNGVRDILHHGNSSD